MSGTWSGARWRATASTRSIAAWTAAGATVQIASKVRMLRPRATPTRSDRHGVPVRPRQPPTLGATGAHRRSAPRRFRRRCEPRGNRPALRTSSRRVPGRATAPAEPGRWLPAGNSPRARDGPPAAAQASSIARLRASIARRLSRVAGRDDAAATAANTDESVGGAASTALIAAASDMPRRWRSATAADLLDVLGREPPMAAREPHRAGKAVPAFPLAQRCHADPGPGGNVANRQQTL